MNTISRDSRLWGYMPDEIKNLVIDGEIILTFVYENKPKSHISDYSFLVFSFAKAYEGYLKYFFMDLGIISEEDYYSNVIRIGRILNPHFLESKENIFKKLEAHKKVKNEVPTQLWKAWKQGRNLVFHYFPRNFRRLSYNEALDVINQIIDAMYASIALLKNNHK